MKIVAVAVLACALLVVPAAGADGVTYTILSGVAGDNGWYRSSVKVQITGTGTCTDQVITFNVSSDAFSCTAGSAHLDLQFRIDPNPPTVTGETVDRAPDKNGWYTHPLTVTFAGTDGNSGIASCATTSYAGPDAGSTSAAGTCRDNAGNVSAPASFPLKYDATPPSINAAPARAADANGWFNHTVGVAFTGTDATSGIDSCTPSTSYSGPDAAAASVAGSCVDQAGNRASATFALEYDATAPQAGAAVARPPDANGWYTHPVAVTFSGTDALSGLAACTAPRTYSGPDDGTAHVDGTCQDKAGNSASASAPMHYDATAPHIAGVTAEVGDGSVTLSWHQPKDTTGVAITRSPASAKSQATPVYKGRATRFHDAGLRTGVTYRYTLTARDEAGNEATAHVDATVRALYAPAPGSRARAGDRLAWVPSKGADYYNVQLFRNGHKVLTDWPVTASFRLPRSWTFKGQKHTLRRGTYRWYVWPGHGDRAQARYGALIGGSLFHVR